MITKKRSDRDIVLRAIDQTPTLIPALDLGM